MGLLSGLEIFGLDEISDTSVFVKKGPKDNQKAAHGKIAAASRIEDFLYKKSFTCEVCDKDFQETVVKKAKIRYVSSETDLKPHYEPLQPLYYDITMCPYCGYAAISSLFHRLTSRQAELIQQKITPKFITKSYPLVLTEDMAIERYKLALLNAAVKSAGNGEKSYICMKLAWLHRDKGDKNNERLYLENAYNGFKEAYIGENFPILGMDEPTVAYLIGELARRLGDYSEALKWIGSVVIRKNINTRLKDRAMNVKDMIKEDMKNHTSHRP